MSEKSKVVIIGGTSNGVHSIIRALNAADLDVVTVVKDEKTLHAELSESLFSDSAAAEGVHLGVSALSEYAIGESIIDPLQDAIGSTETACRSAQGETLEIMQNHLKALLLIQLAKELRAAEMTIHDIQMRGERKS